MRTGLPTGSPTTALCHASPPDESPNAGDAPSAHDLRAPPTSAREAHTAAARPSPPRATRPAARVRGMDGRRRRSPRMRERAKRSSRYASARSTAASACSSVVSKSGTGTSGCWISMVISVQPAITPSAPSRISPSITAR